MQAESDQLAADLRAFCENMPTPPKERIFSQVYEDGNPVLAAQRDTYLSYASGFEGGDH